MTVKDILFGSQKTLPTNGGDPYWDNVTLLIKAESSATNSMTFTSNLVGVYEYSNYNTPLVTGTAANTQNTTPAKFGSTAIFNSSSAAGKVHSAGPSANLAVGVGNFTLEFWVYFSTGNSIAQSFFTFANSSTAIYLRLSTTDIFANITISKGVWYHIAIVRNGTQHFIYVNGVSTDGFTTTTAAFDATSYIVFGSRFQNSATDEERLLGSIEEVRLTKGVARYTANFTPPTTEFPIWKDNSPKPLTKIVFSTYRTYTTSGVVATAGTWDGSPTLTYQWQKYTDDTNPYWADMAGETSLNLVGTYTNAGAYRLKETATSGSLVSKQYSPQLYIYSGGGGL